MQCWIIYWIWLTETRKRAAWFIDPRIVGLKKAAQAHAFIEQRSYVTPDDVQAVFAAVVCAWSWPKRSRNLAADAASPDQLKGD